MKSFVHVACAIVVASGTAHAEDRWSETVTFSRSDQSSIKVSEPEGYKITVDVAGTPVSDTAPAIIRLPNTNAFYKVTLTAPSGAQWSKKIEAKSFSSTDVKVVHVADAQKAAPAAKRKRIGWISNNSSGCRTQWPMRFDFVDAAGNAVASSEVGHGRERELTVPEGEYDVRMYARASAKQEWSYQAAGRANIGRDSWKVIGGCSKEGPGVWFEK